MSLSSEADETAPLPGSALPVACEETEGDGSRAHIVPHSVREASSRLSKSLVLRHGDFGGSGVRHARAGGHLGRTSSGLSLSCLDSRVRGNDVATVYPSFSLW